MTLEKPGSRFLLGLDLGQARDHSAIAIAERLVELNGARDPITFVQQTRTRIIIRHLERIPLRTPYLDVVARVRAVTQQYQGRHLQVVMDATGVGAAVRDMLATCLPPSSFIGKAHAGNRGHRKRGRRTSHRVAPVGPVVNPSLSTPPDPCPSSSRSCADEMHLRPVEGSRWYEEW
jgi:hypothetical protein